MKCNVGAVDRITRGLVGIIVGSGGMMLETPLLHWPMILVGSSLILTSVFAWCPLYYSTGLSTDSETN